MNPLIAQKLPDFYYKTIGANCNNQIWLVTHSEAILKEAFGNANYSVFHLRSADDKNTQQACELGINSDIEAALMDLVGDISSYKPGNKVLLLEGENSDFDKSLIQRLFSEYCKDINIISAGSKNNVTNLHTILEKAVAEGVINKKFYSITDRDYIPKQSGDESKSFQWDVYHIENYLLDSYYIQKVLMDISLTGAVSTVEEIETDLKKIANESIDLLTRQNVSNYVDRFLYNTGAKPKKNVELSEAYHSLAVTVNQHITKCLRQELSIDNLKNIESQERLKITNSFKTDEWKRIFKGREILKTFSSRKSKLNYEQFRNMIISKMAYESFEACWYEESIRKDS